MARIVFLMFWIPAAASAVNLLISWNVGILRRPVLLLAWFGLALLFQFVGDTFSPGWAIGLALQTILAVYLAVRMKLDL